MRLQEHLADCPRLLTDFDREVLLRLAAEDAARAGAAPPFSLRPGLLAAMLGFYDELRRRGRTIDALDRVIGDTLEAGRETDRGAERLLQQTRFLAATFAAFERRIGDSGRIDEHGLRTLLLSDGYRSPYRHAVLAVADQAAGPRGLWPVDFDLLSRLAGLERIDVVATEAVLGAGWLQRLHDALPELDEDRVPDQSAPPLLVAPPPREGFEGPVVWVVCRDREEELVEAARRIKRRAREHGPIALERIAVVFQRPLAVPLSRAPGVHRGPHSVSGVRRAAAGGRAVRGSPRSALRGRRRGRHPRGAHRAALVAALVLSRSTTAGSRGREAAHRLARSPVAGVEVPGRMGGAGASRRACRHPAGGRFT